RLLRAASGNEWLLQLTVLLMATVSSTIINDTTVVLIFLPLIMGICKEKGLSPSRYLLFAAYGSLLGGQWTLIGTRSNIIISDFLRLHNGDGIGFFAFSPVASAVFAVSAVFLMLVGRRFLPEAIPALSRDVMKEFLTEVDVPAGSSAIDQRLEEVSPFADEGVAVAALIRKGRRLPLYTRLRAGDVIIVRGTVDHIGTLIKSSDFRVVEESKLDEKALQSADLVTVEAVLPTNSTYVGRPLNQIPVRRTYGLTLVGLARHGRPVETRIMSTTLEAGDSILFLGGAEEIARLRENPGLIVLEDQPFTAIGRRKAWTIALLLAGVIGLAVSGLLTPTISIPVAAMLAILLGTISWRAAYESVDWPTLVTLGAMISFGTAMEQTGAAEGIADFAVRYFAGVTPVFLLAGLLLIAILLTQVIENAAVAIIMAPVAYQV
ncbi:MAG: SLC13 family permease, partial [Gemmatimonadales bacterium]